MSSFSIEVENGTYGIRVQYPSHWSIQSNASGNPINIVTFLSPTAPNSNPTATVAIFMERLYNSTTNLNNYALYSHKGYENSSDFPIFKLELNTKSALAGNSAYTIIGTYKDPSAIAKTNGGRNDNR
ncbi:MAG: hypothetical protein WCF23_00455 [Candidatus Nitrosopolaris sp.]